MNTYNADGNKVGTMTAEELKAATTLTDDESAEGQQGDAGASTDDGNGGTGGNAPVEPKTGRMGQIASRRTNSRPPVMETMQQGRRHPETMKRMQRGSRATQERPQTTKTEALEEIHQ